MIKLKKRDLFNPGKDIGLAEIIGVLGGIFVIIGIFLVIFSYIAWQFDSLYTIIRVFILGSLFLFFSVYKIGIEK